MSACTCHDLLGDLSAYIDGELDPALCAEIDAHMAEGENCRAVVHTLQETVALYRTLPRPALPEEVGARLRQALAAGAE
jgi:anti-sigma factor RsiW